MTGAAHQQGKINEWLRDRYAELMRDRYHGAVRAQTRYLFLLLVISAYTAASHLTGGESVQVPFLGLAVARPLVEAFAASTLAVLLLALFGSLEVMRRTLAILPVIWGVDDKHFKAEFVESEPNLLDFLWYCTFVDGDPTPSSGVGLLLYMLPLFTLMGWTVQLWWIGIHTSHNVWPWLTIVHVLNLLLVILAVMRLVVVWRYAWRNFQALRRARAPAKQG